MTSAYAACSLLYQQCADGQGHLLSYLGWLAAISLFGVPAAIWQGIKGRRGYRR